MRKQGFSFSFLPWSMVQILLLIALPACSATPAPTPMPGVAGPRILDVEANAASVGRYEKLELAVVLEAAYDKPYDARQPPLPGSSRWHALWRR